MSHQKTWHQVQDPVEQVSASHIPFLYPGVSLCSAGNLLRAASPKLMVHVDAHSIAGVGKGVKSTWYTFMNILQSQLHFLRWLWYWLRTAGPEWSQGTFTSAPHNCSIKSTTCLLMLFKGPLSLSSCHLATIQNSPANMDLSGMDYALSFPIPLDIVNLSCKSQIKGLSACHEMLALDMFSAVYISWQDGGEK